jgi:hypothetical protein
MNNTSSPLKAFKRAPSLGLSKWEPGNLTTNLAETKDTNGAFLLMECTLAPGTEPPPPRSIHHVPESAAVCIVRQARANDPEGLRRLQPINNRRRQQQLWQRPAELPEGDCAQRHP